MASADDTPALPVTPDAITHHSVVAGGKTLRYNATASALVLKDRHQGQPAASIFSVAYTLAGGSPATRPVAFLWNGGPGSSSLWLHMGSFGPLRVAVNDTGTIVPPAHLVANDATLLDATDLVFVDAPGTGYSRIGGKGKKEQFYGVDQDARAFTQFIERWLTAHDRWGSPKFLIGESYGTTRAANVVDRLQIDGVAINGVVLISSALNLVALDPALPGDEMSNVAFLPSEAAVAWYHDASAANTSGATCDVSNLKFKTSPRVHMPQRCFAEIRSMPAARSDVIAALHRYTGLDAAYIDRADLRIDPTRFEKELLRGRRQLDGPSRRSFHRLRSRSQCRFAGVRPNARHRDCRCVRG